MGRNIISSWVKDNNYNYKLERFTWRQLAQVAQAVRSWHNKRPLRLPKSCPGLRESIWDALTGHCHNQVDLPGHCSSGQTYWTGSGAVGTSQKDCCRRFCQVPECCFWKKLAKIKQNKKTCLWFSRSGAQAFKVETVTLLRPISAVYYLVSTWTDDSMSDWFFLVEFLYIYVMICIWSKINL